VTPAIPADQTNPLTWRQLQRNNAITAATRQSLVKIQLRPKPPRGLTYGVNGLAWEKPTDLSNVTHFRVYANNENNLVRQIPVGQQFLNDNLVADRVFVSSYNANSGLESQKVAFLSAISPFASGGVTLDAIPVDY
jgi:hypothetical protein